MNTVQIAIRNQKYALALRRLLLSDGKHNVLLVNQPDAAIEGVMVVDERLRTEIVGFDKAALTRTVVFIRQTNWVHLRDLGVQNIIHKDSPAYLGLQVVLGLEHKLAAREAAEEISEELHNLREAIANVIWASPEIAEALEAFHRRGRDVQIEFDAIVISREEPRDVPAELPSERAHLFDDADKSFLQALKISVP